MLPEAKELLEELEKRLPYYKFNNVDIVYIGIDEYEIRSINDNIVELVEKMWSEHQVLVATHLNTGTYHNHFVICSVNMFTGEKFNCNKGAYYRFRGLSDELCEKYDFNYYKKSKRKNTKKYLFC